VTTRVVVFGRDSNLCVMCKYTKRDLDKLAVPYVERNVDTDTQAMQIVAATGKTQLPMVDVMHGDELVDRWHGYHRHKIRGLVL
jgi:glutaredoxin